MNIQEQNINFAFKRIVEQVTELRRFQGNEKAVATLDAVVKALNAQRAQLEQL